MSNDFGGNPVNNLSDLSTQHPEQRLEIGPIVACRHGWITLAVAHCDYYMDDCFVEAHIRRRTIEGKRADLCAIFDFPAARNEPWVSIADIHTTKVHAEFGPKGTMCDERKQLVFVPIGQFTQDTEQWWQVGVRAVVRLIPLDCCPHWIANNAELFPANNGVIKVRPIIGDGELEPAFVAGRFRKHFVAGYRIHEMIQTATKGINAISDHQGPPIERRRFIDTDNDTVTGAVSIHLLQDAVRISFHPGRDFIADGLSMFRTVS